MKILNFLPSLPLLLLLAASPGCAPRARKAPDPMTQPLPEDGLRLVLTLAADEATLGRAVERTKQVVGKRCELLKLECEVGPEPGGGANQLRLNVSGPITWERMYAVLLAQGLELRPVVSPPFPSPVRVYDNWPEAYAAARGENHVIPYGDGPERVFLVVKPEPVITGEHARDPWAFIVEGTADQYAVHFDLSLEGSNRLGGWTDANVNNYLAVVYNDKTVAVPYIKGPIYENGEINGGFTREQAEEVVLVLASGHLPARIKAVERAKEAPNRRARL